MVKSYWIIPNNEVLDGAKLALKNADELNKSAKILFEHDRFVHALSIATLALEEFGKHCILKEHETSNTIVDSKLWFSTIKNHEEKLKAIPTHLEQTPIEPSEEVKKELNRYRKYLLELSKLKLEHLYLDWNSIKKKWALVGNSKSIKAKAKFAIDTANWTIEKYLEDLQWDRELLFMPHKEIVQLFENKKVHAFCNLCSIPLITRSELLYHRKFFKKHDAKISWHFNE